MQGYLMHYFNKMLTRNRSYQGEPQQKKPLFKSYAEGVVDTENGDSYSTILGYFWPEFITSLVLYSLIPLIDARWIANLKSTSLYATMGVTNTLLHFIVKVAEGFSVGTVILAGRYNGKQDYEGVGQATASAFWVTVVVGGVISILLYIGAPYIYYWYGVPQKMVTLGVPILRLRAVGIFFMYIYFALVGFLRGIKNPRVPMALFIMGGILFLIFDYLLIFGKAGFPALGLFGSAWASVMQYGFMLIAAIAYVLFDKNNRKYGISLFSQVASWQHAKTIIRLSLPVAFDKALFAAAYIWLGLLINPMGKYAIASYHLIRELEKLAIQPAAAFAQVITYLVSNRYGSRDWKGIKSNVKKTIFLASLSVFAIITIFALNARTVIQFFDQKGKFTDFSAQVFPIISVLIFLDLLQLILSGALRGAANVKAVMWTRLLVFSIYFLPISLVIHYLSVANPITKFLLLYCSFYIGGGIMSLMYIYIFRGNSWKQELT